MDNREFVRLAKREAIDSAVKNILGKLNAPRANGPLPAVQADDIVHLYELVHEEKRSARTIYFPAGIGEGSGHRTDWN
jgi:hypothetical protein